ncbi:hypothetical protein EV361DRAFT_772621, partial [Lentinula raphanica]
IDDCGLKGPTSRYNEQEIYPGIRKFVWEYIERMDLLLGTMIEAGITASGSKAVVAAVRLKIVGTVVALEGWIMEPSMVTKI